MKKHVLVAPGVDKPEALVHESLDRAFCHSSNSPSSFPKSLVPRPSREGSSTALLQSYGWTALPTVTPEFYTLPKNVAVFRCNVIISHSCDKFSFGFGIAFDVGLGHGERLVSGELLNEFCRKFLV